MAISADDYGRQLQALLPPGPAWEADLDPFHEQLLVPQDTLSLNPFD